MIAHPATIDLQFIHSQPRHRDLRPPDWSGHLKFLANHRRRLIPWITGLRRGLRLIPIDQMLLRPVIPLYGIIGRHDARQLRHVLTGMRPPLHRRKNLHLRQRKTKTPFSVASQTRHGQTHMSRRDRLKIVHWRFHPWIGDVCLCLVDHHLGIGKIRLSPRLNLEPDRKQMSRPVRWCARSRRAKPHSIDRAVAAQVDRHPTDGIDRCGTLAAITIPKLGCKRTVVSDPPGLPVGHVKQAHRPTRRRTPRRRSSLPIPHPNFPMTAQPRS